MRSTTVVAGTTLNWDGTMSETEQPDPEHFEKRAEQYEEVDDHISDAISSLQAARRSDVVEDNEAVKLNFLEQMIGIVRHNAGWSYAAYHCREHAQRLEREQERNNVCDGNDGDDGTR